MEHSRKNQKEYVFIRNQYYPGKLLHASDFVREQEYGNSKLAFANRKFFGSGIIDGLKVQAGQAGDWYVTAGSAIDPAGRFLVLPEDTRVDFEDLDGLLGEEGSIFVLGIRYAEQVLEREHSIFEGKETYQAARVAEGVVFGAYSLGAWRQLKAEVGGYEEKLTQERVLYENREVRLLLKIPKLVPADSLFCVRIQAVAVGGGTANIGWRGTAKLQGAFFTESGNDCLVLEKKQTDFSGMLQQEWEICTEEGRNLPVLFELSQLELLREGSVCARVGTVQVSVETAENYRGAAGRYLWDGERGMQRIDGWQGSGQNGSALNESFPAGSVQDESVRNGKFLTRSMKDESIRNENLLTGSKLNESTLSENFRNGSICNDTRQADFPWLPLACFKVVVGSDGKQHFSIIHDHAVRIATAHPQEGEILRRAAEENGIVDIRWRSLLRNGQFSVQPQPVPPFLASAQSQSAPPQPAPPLLSSATTPPALAPNSSEPSSGLFENEWAKHICRGVTVIPVPKHYRKGQVLLSEEISHGFAGEEVAIWCGRLRETEGHVYWERDKKSFFVIQGNEGLFPEQKGGWEIEKQALRQNVAAGTFQIALTLLKGRRRNRVKEVAVSWIVVRSI